MSFIAAGLSQRRHIYSADTLKYDRRPIRHGTALLSLAMLSCDMKAIK